MPIQALDDTGVKGRSPQCLPVGALGDVAVLAARLCDSMGFVAMEMSQVHAHHSLDFIAEAGATPVRISCAMCCT